MSDSDLEPVSAPRRPRRLALPAVPAMRVANLVVRTLVLALVGAFVFTSPWPGGLRGGLEVVAFVVAATLLVLWVPVDRAAPGERRRSPTLPWALASITLLCGAASAMPTGGMFVLLGITVHAVVGKEGSYEQAIASWSCSTRLTGAVVAPKGSAGGKQAVALTPEQAPACDRDQATVGIDAHPKRAMRLTEARQACQERGLGRAGRDAVDRIGARADRDGSVSERDELGTSPATERDAVNRRQASIVPNSPKPAARCKHDSPVASAYAHPNPPEVGLAGDRSVDLPAQATPGDQREAVTPRSACRLLGQPVAPTCDAPRVI